MLHCEDNVYSYLCSFVSPCTFCQSRKVFLEDLLMCSWGNSGLLVIDPAYSNVVQYAPTIWVAHCDTWQTRQYAPTIWVAHCDTWQTRQIIPTIQGAHCEM